MSTISSPVDPNTLVLEQPFDSIGVFKIAKGDQHVYVTRKQAVALVTELTWKLAADREDEARAA